MEAIEKITGKIMNFKKEWEDTPLDKKLIKSFIIAFLLTISPAVLFLGAMFLFAVILYIPGWAYFLIICAVVVLRKIKKKVKESMSESSHII